MKTLQFSTCFRRNAEHDESEWREKKTGKQDVDDVKLESTVHENCKRYLEKVRKHEYTNCTCIRAGWCTCTVEIYQLSRDTHAISIDWLCFYRWVSNRWPIWNCQLVPGGCRVKYFPFAVEVSFSVTMCIDTFVRFMRALVYAHAPIPMLQAWNKTAALTRYMCVHVHVHVNCVHGNRKRLDIHLRIEGEIFDVDVAGRNEHSSRLHCTFPL